MLQPSLLLEAFLFILQLSQERLEEFHREQMFRYQRAQKAISSQVSEGLIASNNMFLFSDNHGRLVPSQVPWGLIGTTGLGVIGSTGSSRITE